MKIVSLTRQELTFFTWMDPFQRTQRLEFPGRFAYGAIVKSKDGESDIPAGLLTGVIWGNRIVIEWLFVAEEYRMQGIGDSLLTEVVNRAQKEEIPFVAAYLLKEYGSDIVCQWAEDYFVEHLFQMEKEVPGEWITTLSNLSFSPFLKEMPKQDADIIPLNMLNKSEIKGAVANLMKKRGTRTLYKMTGEEYRLDGSISVVLQKGKELCGGLLIHKVNDTLYPVLLSMETLNDAKILIFYSLMLARKKYPHSMGVRIIIDNQELVPLIDRILPEKRMEGKLFSVKTDEYFSERSALEDITCAAFSRKIDKMLEEMLRGELMYEEESWQRQLTVDSNRTEEKSSHTLTEQDCIITVQDLADCIYLQHTDGPELVKNIGTLDLEQLHAVLDRCHEKRPCVWFDEDLSKLSFTWFESELSCFIQKNDEICGILLIHPEGTDRLWVEYMAIFLPNMEKLNIELLRYAANQAVINYPPETEVVIRRHTKNVAMLVERFFV